MTPHEELLAAVCEAGHDDAVLFDTEAFDGALVGFTQDGRAVYDYEMMVDGLVHDDGMEPEEAADFIGYNTIRAIPYAGPKAPVVVFKFDKNDWI